MVHHWTTIIHAKAHYKPSQFRETPNKQTMIAAIEAVLTWNYCHIFQYLEELLNVLIQQFQFCWVLALSRRSHIHADLFNSYLFYLRFGCPTANFGWLLRRQPHSPHFSHSIFIFFDSKVTRNLIATSF